MGEPRDGLTVDQGLGNVSTILLDEIVDVAEDSAGWVSWAAQLERSDAATHHMVAV